MSASTEFTVLDEHGEPLPWSRRPPWTDYDAALSRGAQYQWSADTLQPRRQVGRLAMLDRIATHKPEAL